MSKARAQTGRDPSRQPPMITPCWWLQVNFRLAPREACRCWENRAGSVWATGCRGTGRAGLPVTCCQCLPTIRERRSCRMRRCLEAATVQWQPPRSPTHTPACSPLPPHSRLWAEGLFGFLVPGAGGAGLQGLPGRAGHGLEPGAVRRLVQPCPGPAPRLPQPARGAVHGRRRDGGHAAARRMPHDRAHHPHHRPARGAAHRHLLRLGPDQLAAQVVRASSVPDPAVVSLCCEEGGGT